MAQPSAPVSFKGFTVKSGPVFWCKNNGRKDYVSDYLYTLKITQEEKIECTTSVEVDRNSVVGSIVYSPVDTGTNEFTFTSKHLHTTGNNNCKTTFGGTPENDFVNGQSNSLRIVFTNVKMPYVAPTAFTSRHTPFILMLIIGILVLTLSGVGIVRAKKRLPDSRPAKVTVHPHRQWVEYRTPLVRC